MQISAATARAIISRIQPMIPYEIVVLNLSGENPCEPQKQSREEMRRLIQMEDGTGERTFSRVLRCGQENAGYLVIFGRQESEDFPLLLDLAREIAESILAQTNTNSKSNYLQNYQLALRNLLEHHSEIDVDAVLNILQKNNFDLDCPRTIIYFKLITIKQEWQITALRDKTGNITSAGVVYDNFVEFLRITFSRPCDVVYPAEDHQGIYVFCEDRSHNIELSDAQLYNICMQLVELKQDHFRRDFRVVIGKRCTCFADYSGVRDEMMRRMESSILLFPEEHVIFGRATILGNIVAFIHNHAKRSIVELVFGKMLRDKASHIYISTLRNLFQCNMNMSLTARKLNIHRNTLQYRLKKIEELSGYSVYDIDGALTLRMAVLCFSYLEQFPNEEQRNMETG